MEHCLGHSSRHFAFARTWRAAEQYVGTTLGGALPRSGVRVNPNPGNVGTILGGALPDYGVFTREVARLAADAVGTLAWPWQL